MLGDDILAFICNKLAQTDRVIIKKEETGNWPIDTINMLVQHGILRQAEQSRHTECHGCEENCMMPVNILPPVNKRPTRVFIICDKRDDIGAIFVNESALNQWQSSIEYMANALANLLNFVESGTKIIDDKQCHVGIFKGKKRKSPIILAKDEYLNLLLAGHIIPLLDVLSMQQSMLILNTKKLTQLVDNPEQLNETSKDREQRLKARVNEERNKNNRSFLQKIADEEGISVSRLKQIIYRKIPPISK